MESNFCESSRFEEGFGSVVQSEAKVVGVAFVWEFRVMPDPKSVTDGVNQRGRKRHCQTTARGTKLTAAPALTSNPRVGADRAGRGRDLRRQVCPNTLYLYRLRRLSSKAGPRILNPFCDRVSDIWTKAGPEARFGAIGRHRNADGPCAGGHRPAGTNVVTTQHHHLWMYDAHRVCKRSRMSSGR